MKALQYALGENWFVPYGKGTYVKKESWTDDNKLGDNVFKDLVVTVTSPITSAVATGLLTAAGALTTGFSLLFAARGVVQTVIGSGNGLSNVVGGLHSAAIGTALMLLAVPCAILIALAPIARILNTVSRSLATLAGYSISAEHTLPKTPALEDPNTIRLLMEGDETTLHNVNKDTNMLIESLPTSISTQNQDNITKKYRDSLQKNEHINEHINDASPKKTV